MSSFRSPPPPALLNPGGIGTKENRHRPSLIWPMTQVMSADATTHFLSPSGNRPPRELSIRLSSGALGTLRPEELSRSGPSTSHPNLLYWVEKVTRVTYSSESWLLVCRTGLDTFNCILPSTVHLQLYPQILEVFFFSKKLLITP